MKSLRKFGEFETNTSRNITTIWMKSSKTSAVVRPSIRRESWIDDNGNLLKTSGRTIPKMKMLES